MPSSEPILATIKDLAFVAYQKHLLKLQSDRSQFAQQSFKQKRADNYQKAYDDFLNACLTESDENRLAVFSKTFEDTVESATADSQKNLDFKQLFEDKLNSNPDFIKQNLPNDYPSVLKNQIKNVYNYYCYYSNRYCSHSIFHRHGKNGRQRAKEFLDDINDLTNADEIVNAVINHLYTSSGKTYPHSFKTLLLASFSESFYFSIPPVKLEKNKAWEYDKKSVLGSLNYFLKTTSLNFLTLRKKLFSKKTGILDNLNSQNQVRHEP